MADLNPSSPQKPKELSMETRLILAFTLMGLVLVAAQYLMPNARPQPKPAAKQEQSQTQPPAAVEAQAQPGVVRAHRDRRMKRIPMIPARERSVRCSRLREPLTC